MSPRTDAGGRLKEKGVERDKGLSLTWSTKQVLGQAPKVHRETMSQKIKKTKQQNKTKKQQQNKNRMESPLSRPLYLTFSRDMYTGTHGEEHVHSHAL